MRNNAGCMVDVAILVLFTNDLLSCPLCRLMRLSLCAASGSKPAAEDGPLVEGDENGRKKAGLS